MKILIIIHRFNAGDGFHYDEASIAKNYSYYLPAGMGYIISSLKAAGFNVHVLNLNHIQGMAQGIIQNTMTADQYDLVYTGGVSLYYPALRDIIRYIRAVSPATKIVVGGGIITAQPDVMFSLLKPDIAVIGEGERTCVEIARNLVRYALEPLREVPGLIFRNPDGLPEYTSPRDPIQDLDTLPFPDYESMGLPELLDNTPCSYIYDHFDYPRPYPILASRGCTHACSFCFHTIGNRYRQRSIGNIMKEVRQAVEKYRINLFFFYDELFTADEKRALEFCRQFKEYTKTIPYEIKFIVELRVDGITPALLDALKDAGCDNVCLGLESYSQKVLDSMGKHIDAGTIPYALEQLSIRDMAPVGNFIFGDHAEDLGTAEETLSFFRTRQDILSGTRVAFIIPFQGSRAYQRYMNTGAFRDVIDGTWDSHETFAEDRARLGYDFHEPVNMTLLSDKDFDTLKDRVFTAHYTEGTYSTGEVHNGSLYCLCPVCRLPNYYPTMKPPGKLGMVNVGCRHCNSRYEMTGKWFWLVQWAIRTVGFMRLYRIRKMLSGA